jgi:serine/threonine protein kinase
VSLDDRLEVDKRRQEIAELFAETHDVGEFRRLSPWMHTFAAIEKASGDRVEIQALASGLSEQSYFLYRRNIPLSARLIHPGLQRVRDHGLREDVTFVIVDDVGGQPLDHRLSRDNYLPVADALRIAHECAEALHYMHEQRMVARDLSVGMILLTKERAVLTAHLEMSFCFLGPGTNEAILGGSFAHLSPEVLSGELASPRSDVYSLGAILYQLLTGHAPFGGGPRDVFAGISGGDRPRPSRLRDIPASIDDVVMKAMAIDPKDRFSSAAEFARAISAEVARPPGNAKAGFFSWLPGRGDSKNG